MRVAAQPGDGTTMLLLRSWIAETGSAGASLGSLEPDEQDAQQF